MLIETLLGEFLHEAENTRKLLNAIPDSALNYKPWEKGWTTAELASHIAGMYNWMISIFEQDVLELSTYKYDKGDTTKAANIVAKFEENMQQAKPVLEKATDDDLAKIWRMTMNGVDVFKPMTKGATVRGAIFNHIYHHRGELVVYLRATGNKVPGLYGPTAEEKM